MQGKFESPSGAPLVGGVLTLRLSQVAALVGSYAVVPTPVVCYTTSDGSVVGAPDPTAAPVLTAEVGLGTLPAGTYFVRTTVYTATGESLPSPEAVVTLDSQGAIEIQAQGSVPQGDSVGVYVSTASGAETRQALSGTDTYTLSVPLTAGAALPAANGSQCSFAFNDAMVPAPTYYIVTLADSAGNTIPGYPQNWYLWGPLMDVSDLQPLSTPPSLYFEAPVVENPASSAPQSINSDINLNGYALQNTNNVGPGIVSAFWSGALPLPGSTVFVWTPNAAVSVRRVSLFAETAGNGGTAGTALQLSNGLATCVFPSLLPGAGVSGSGAALSGNCQFSAGLPVTATILTDDHSTRPSNVTIQFEETAQ